MKLSTNFSFHEFESADGTAPNGDVLKNLTELAKNLEVLRKHIGQPIRVTSGFRSKEHKKEKPVSGYRIYNKEFDRKTVRNDLPSLYPDLPEKRYDIIYCDPPWDYGGKMQFDKTGKKEINKNWEKNIFISAANFQYPTVKTKDLKRIPIKELAKEDCLLFMWVTSPHLEQGIDLGKAWGFEFRTVAFVWDKMVHNPGQYTLSYCEMCLVFKRGKIPTPRGSRNEKQLIRVPRGKHSEKPLEVLKAIERMFPTQDKVELFARHKPKNWDVWGLDVREEYLEEASNLSKVYRNVL